MKITIQIATDNDAFADDKDDEVFRILNEWIKSVQQLGLRTYRLRDINGNTVGSVTVKE